MNSPQLTVANALHQFGLEAIEQPLAEFLVAQRWFGGREREVTSIHIDDVGLLHEADPVTLLVIAAVEYAVGAGDLYTLPISLVHADHGDLAGTQEITTLDIGGVPHVVLDALSHPRSAATLWTFMRQRRKRVATARAELSSSAQVTEGEVAATHLRPVTAEQTNSAVIRDSVEFLKWVRRLDPGPSVEVEMTSALAAAGFPHMPEQLGGIDYHPSHGEQTRIALLERFLHNGAEGWALALGSLRDLYASAEEAQWRDALHRQAAIDDAGGTFIHEAARLGEVAAEMHLALASDVVPASMAAKAVGGEILNRWADTMTAELDDLLDDDNDRLLPLREVRDRLVSRIDAIRRIGDGGRAIRLHGDFHLGQVTRTNDGWVILDYEGEPARPVEERRRRWSPLRDVAGMLRSFDYAAAVALNERMTPQDEGYVMLASFGDAWALTNREAFWSAYLGRLGTSSPLLPRDGGSLTLRWAFEIQKAVYEVRYEVRHRPTWVAIPISFLQKVAP